VISGGKDHTIRHWDMMTGKQLASHSTQQVYNLDLSWSETVMVSTHLKDMRLWSIGTGQVIHSLKNAHADYVTCARFTPDERYLVSTGQDHLVKVWDVRTWRQLYGQGFEDEQYTCPYGVLTTKFCISPNG
jgi:WD40 repeat protein